MYKKKITANLHLNIYGKKTLTRMKANKLPDNMERVHQEQTCTKEISKGHIMGKRRVDSSWKAQVARWNGKQIWQIYNYL